MHQQKSLSLSLLSRTMLLLNLSLSGVLLLVSSWLLSTTIRKVSPTTRTVSETGAERVDRLYQTPGLLLHGGCVVDVLHGVVGAGGVGVDQGVVTRAVHDELLHPGAHVVTDGDFHLAHLVGLKDNLMAETGVGGTGDWIHSAAVGWCWRCQSLARGGKMRSFL